jgi:hypothetical protein
MEGEKPTENSAPSPLEILNGEHLSVVGQNLDCIPAYLGEKHGDKIRQLDLSYNNIRFATNSTFVSD